MPTLPELFDALAADGKRRGAQAVVDRAIAHHGDDIDDVPFAQLLANATPTRSARARRVWIATAAAAAALVIAIPNLISRGDDRSIAPSNTGSRATGGPLRPLPNLDTVTPKQLATFKWSTIPVSPIGYDGKQVAVWDGTEVLVWGFLRQTSETFGSGAAFNPSTNQWRILPPAPVQNSAAPMDGASAQWTGTEFVVIASSMRVNARLGGIAYNPVSNSWRTIADGPNCSFENVATTWTGREIFAISGTFVDGIKGCPRSQLANTAFYNPVTDTWRSGSPLPYPATGTVHILLSRTTMAFGEVVVVSALAGETLSPQGAHQAQSAVTTRAGSSKPAGATTVGPAAPAAQNPTTTHGDPGPTTTSVPPTFMSVRLNRVTEQWGRPSQSDAFGDVYGNNDFLVLAPWKEFCFSSYCASGESSGRGIASWRGGAHTIQYSRVDTGLETVIATAFTGSILIVVSTPITYAPTCPKEANCREADGAQEAYANRISKADAGGFPLAAPLTSLNGSLSVWTGHELIVFGFTRKGTDGPVYLNGTRLAP